MQDIIVTLSLLLKYWPLFCDPSICYSMETAILRYRKLDSNWLVPMRPWASYFTSNFIFVHYKSLCLPHKLPKIILSNYVRKYLENFKVSDKMYVYINYFYCYFLNCSLSIFSCPKRLFLKRHFIVLRCSSFSKFSQKDFIYSPSLNSKSFQLDEFAYSQINISSLCLPPVYQVCIFNCQLNSLVTLFFFFFSLNE